MVHGCVEYPYVVFNIGPLEFLVLAAVALMVFGPDKLPQMTKDAARMLRTLRDLAQGARTQLTSELGPEFANFDLNSLNPKTAIRNALLGDEDFSTMNPKDALQRALRGEDDPKPATPPTASTNPAGPANPGGHTLGPRPGGDAVGPQPGGDALGPPTAGGRAPYDPDAT